VLARVTDPITLPPCDPGGPIPEAVAASINDWVTSPELAELVKHFGGVVPAGPLASVLDHVAEFSGAWDFRGGTKERFDTERVHYDAGLDERVRSLIRTLGLGGRPGPAHPTYDHVVVLGGGIRVSLGRSGYAVGLLTGGGVTARTLAGLGSLRHRDDREYREGLRLGLDPVETEADMMMVGLRKFLGLPPEPTAERAGDGWWHRTWSVDGAGNRPGVAEVHVLAAASSRPPRRANTADTLLGWAEHVGAPVPTDRLLLVTNDPYVRHQHCDAVRLLGKRYGCGIETVGYDDDTMREWGRPLSTTELLQEVRSSILAMRNLFRAV
jgi:hypothetical protein